MKKVINIALWGCGTVGSGVLEILKSNGELVRSKSGAEINVKYIIENNSARIKNIHFGRAQVRKKISVAIEDPEVDIIIELVGGIKKAKEGIISALRAGKHVVTANKAVLSHYWDDLFGECRKNRVLLYFEASVAGGIPVLQVINEGLAANRIKSIAGILNGTTNYILTKMAKDNFDFKTALASAKVNGFAERNPYLDISGGDSMHKLSILSSLAFGKWIRKEWIHHEGITKISNIDIMQGREEFGYVLKLLAYAASTREGLELFVVPGFLPETHPLANVDNEYNAVLVRGDLTGDTMYYGKGAGKLPAASAVVSDLIFIARQVRHGVAGLIPYVTAGGKGRARIKPIGEISGKYYLRFTTLDRPGVLSSISGILGRNNVSIRSCIQKGLEKSGVPILVVTHQAKEDNVKKAIEEIDRLRIITKKTVLIRIFENL